MSLVELAPALDAIPMVDDAATRDARFPLATRVQNQRVFRLDLGIQQRWSGSSWVDDSARAYLVDSSVEGGAAANAVVTALMARVPAGSTIQFRPGASYTFTAAIAVTKALRFEMTGATLTQTTANTPLFACTASGCQWHGGTLVGPQYLAQHANENAIQVIGASAASPVTDIVIDGVTIDTWGLHGIYLQYVTDFTVTDVVEENLHYAGIGVCSGLHGLVSRVRIRNVVGATECYGIFFSRLSTASLVTDPRSEDILCADCVVRDIPTWEAFDTHGGKNVRFRNIAAYNSNTGLAIVPAGNGTTLQAYAPLDCHASGVVVDSQQTTGSRDAGVKFCGAEGTPGASTEYATGSLHDISVSRHGIESSSINGGLYLRDTLGLEISGVLGIECSPSTVLIYHDNSGINLSQVVSVDHWSQTGLLACAVFANDDYNTGRIDGVSAVRGSKSAARVLEKGIRLSNLSHNAFQIGTNDLAACGTPLDDGGSKGATLLRAPVTFAQKATFTSGLVSSADIDATGGFRCPPGDGWYQNTITANGTVTMTRHATRLAYPTAWFASAAGSIVCLWAISDTALAVGAEIDVDLYINGVFALRVAITPAIGTTLARNTSAKDGAGLTFAIGDKLELKSVTSGMSGSASIMAGITIEAS